MGPPSRQKFPLSVQDAVGLSDWYARYALDRVSSEPRHLHRGVKGHLTGATVQLHASAELLDAPPLDLREAA